MASHKHIIGSLVGQKIELSFQDGLKDVCLVTDETRHMVSVATENGEKHYIKKTITFRII